MGLGFSIYDILREADDDNGEAQASPDVNANGNTDSGDTNDDDFSIDTSLDDIGGDDNGDNNVTGGSDDNNGNDGEDNFSGNQKTADSYDANDGNKADEQNDKDAVEDNENLFSSLTAEEQQIKIMELKKQYSNLFSACDSTIEKLNDVDVNEENLHVISKISSSLYDLKTYLSDYLYHVFPDKSYLENDIAYNKFLATYKTMITIMDKVSKKEEKLQNDEK